jgi:hypothetical protein
MKEVSWINPVHISIKLKHSPFQQNSLYSIPVVQPFCSHLGSDNHTPTLPGETTVGWSMWAKGAYKGIQQHAGR